MLVSCCCCCWRKPVNWMVAVWVVLLLIWSSALLMCSGGNRGSTRRNNDADNHEVVIDFPQEVHCTPSDTIPIEVGEQIPKLLTRIVQLHMNTRWPFQERYSHRPPGIEGIQVLVHVQIDVIRPDNVGVDVNGLRKHAAAAVVPENSQPTRAPSRLEHPLLFLLNGFKRRYRNPQDWVLNVAVNGQCTVVYGVYSAWAIVLYLIDQGATRNGALVQHFVTLFSTTPPQQIDNLP